MESLRDWVSDHWLKMLGVAVVLTFVGPGWIGGPTGTVLGVLLIAWLAAIAAALVYFGLRAVLQRLARR